MAMISSWSISWGKVDKSFLFHPESICIAHSCMNKIRSGDSSAVFSQTYWKQQVGMILVVLRALSISRMSIFCSFGISNLSARTHSWTKVIASAWSNFPVVIWTDLKSCVYIHLTRARMTSSLTSSLYVWVWPSTKLLSKAAFKTGEARHANSLWILNFDSLLPFLETMVTRSLGASDPRRRSMRMSTALVLLRKIFNMEEVLRLTRHSELVLDRSLPVASHLCYCS